MVAKKAWAADKQRYVQADGVAVDERWRVSGFLRAGALVVERRFVMAAYFIKSLPQQDFGDGFWNVPYVATNYPMILL